MTVRRARLEDRAALARFYAVAYRATVHWRFPDRWEWEFAGNPFRPGGQLPLWIAEEGGEVIGQSGAMYVRCLVGGRTVSAAWGVDFYVRSSHRGQGIGRELQRANQSEQELFISLGMAEATRAIKAQIGGRPFKKMTLFATVHRVSPADVTGVIERALRKRLQRKPACVAKALFRWSRASRIIAWAMTRKLHRSGPSSPAASNGRLRFEPIEGRFDQRADALWERVRVGYDFAVERGSQHLNWKYREQPLMGYEAAYAVLAGEVVGLVVYRVPRAPERPVGLIADVIAVDESPEVHAAAIGHAIEALRSARVDAIVAGASGEALAAALRDAGFFPYDEYEPMVGGDEAIVSQVVDARRVLLSLGDDDIDQFPNDLLPTTLTLLRRGRRAG